MWWALQGQWDAVVSVDGRRQQRTQWVGERPGRRRRSRRRRPGGVVDDEIDESLAGRERGGETPSSSSVVVGVAPLQQRSGVVFGCARASGPAGPRILLPAEEE